MHDDADIERPADVVDFSWDVIEFDKNFIDLQIEYKNPLDIGAFQSQDYITIKFFGVEYFKSYQGIEVKFGQKLTQQIFR